MFVSALDNCVINRYHDKSQTVASRVNVKYVYAPKQKVLEDLVNKAATVQLPAVAVTVNSLSRDKERVFNKHAGIYLPDPNNLLAPTERGGYMVMPVPVKLSVTLSILTKYMTDNDQIIQNFLVNTNPYFVVSWKVPTADPSQVYELRSKVIWNESIEIVTPVDISATQTSHIEATTSFEIEGWLFSGPISTYPNILTIEEHIIPVVDLHDCIPTTTAETQCAVYDNNNIFSSASNARMNNGIPEIFCPDDGLWYPIAVRMFYNTPVITIDGDGTPSYTTRISNGVPELYCPDDGLWYPFDVQSFNNVPTLTTDGDGES